MKRKIKVIILSCIFIVLLVFSLIGINRILLPKFTMKNSKWPTTSSYEQFYQMKENSIDVLFFGSSLVVNSCIPQEIYNDYGITSYNLGSEQQSIFLSYYWLKEALRFQKPKVVVLDLYFMENKHPENVINTTEPLIRKCLDPMKLSSVKREAVQELCRLDETQDELSFYFTNTRFHSRWEDLNETDFNSEFTGQAELKGFSPLTKKENSGFKPYHQNNTTERMKFPTVMQDYLEKIVELCKENGIELALIELPRKKFRMNDAINNTHTAFAKSKGLNYYNFCREDLFEKIGADQPWESSVEHQNIWGAIKTSRLIGSILKNDYGVESKKDDQYESTREFYEQTKNSAELKRVKKEPVQYLKALNQPQLAVFMVSQDASSVLEQEGVKKALSELGLACRFKEDTEFNYIASIVAGEVKTEQISEETIYDSLMFRDGLSRATLTSGKNEINKGIGSISIDNVVYQAEDNSLLLVVFDLNRNKVIDSVSIFEDQMTQEQ